MNWYNDVDPRACAWMEALIEYGLIAPGSVVCKSIVDVRPENLDDRYTQLHFFSGIGGWARALDLAGFPRNRPIWTASLPCQPYSVAGSKKAQKDERHLWPIFFDLVKARRPVLLIGEQVANAVGFGWTDGVFADLEGAGYSCGQVVLGAHSVSAPHVRQRIYWVARLRDMADPDGRNSSPERLQRSRQHGQQPPDGEAGRRLADHAGLPGAEHEHEQGVGLRRPPQKDHSTERGGPDVGLAFSEGRGLGADGGSSRSGGHAKQCVEAGGFWDDHVWITCSDGRMRRIPRQDIQETEPLLQRMADGLPEGLDLCGADRAFPLLDTLPERAKLLRGFGNAIVAPLAAVFVRAVMEETDSQR